LQFINKKWESSWSSWWDTYYSYIELWDEILGSRNGIQTLFCE